MKHVVGVLPGQLTLGGVLFRWNGAIMLAAGALKAVNGPVSLELLLIGPKLPQQW